MLDFNINLVLKKELGFFVTEDEMREIEKMNSEGFSLYRKKVLDLIHVEHKLTLDQLEEMIHKLKEQEYRYLLLSTGVEDIEKQVELETSLDTRCNQMIINMATGKSNSEGLLGPNVRETYGIGVK